MMPKEDAGMRKRTETGPRESFNMMNNRSRGKTAAHSMRNLRRDRLTEEGTMSQRGTGGNVLGENGWTGKDFLYTAIQKAMGTETKTGRTNV